MSTKAKIGIVNADKTVTSIHLWRDGYPEYAGQMLATRYKTAEQIEMLMRKGNLIDLMPTPGKCNYDKGLQYTSMVNPANNVEMSTSLPVSDIPAIPNDHLIICPLLP